MNSNLERRIAELEAALRRLQTPLNNSVPIPRWAAAIVKDALEEVRR